MYDFFEQPADDKPDIVVLDREPPSSPKEWALFVCPELARHIFKTNTNPHCINKGTILNQVRPHIACVSQTQWWENRVLTFFHFCICSPWPFLWLQKISLICIYFLLHFDLIKYSLSPSYLIRSKCRHNWSTNDWINEPTCSQLTCLDLFLSQRWNVYVCLRQMQSLYYLDLLQKELCSLALDHLKLPVMHLAEVIALDLLGRSRLSELYRLR